MGQFDKNLQEKVFRKCIRNIMIPQMMQEKRKSSVYDQSLQKALSKSKSISKRTGERRKVMQKKLLQFKQLCLYIRSQSSIINDKLTQKVTQLAQIYTQNINQPLQTQQDPEKIQTKIVDSTKGSQVQGCSQMDNQKQKQLHINIPKPVQNLQEQSVGFKSQSEQLNKSNIFEKVQSSGFQVSQNSTPQFTPGDKTPYFLQRSHMRQSDRDIFPEDIQEEKNQVKMIIEAESNDLKYRNNHLHVYNQQDYQQNSLLPQQDSNKAIFPFPPPRQFLYNVNQTSFPQSNTFSNIQLHSYQNQRKQSEKNLYEQHKKSQNLDDIDLSDYNFSDESKKKVVNLENNEIQNQKDRQFESSLDNQNLNSHNLPNTQNVRRQSPKMNYSEQCNPNTQILQSFLPQPSRGLFLTGNLPIPVVCSIYQPIDISKLEVNKNFIYRLENNPKLAKARRKLFEQKTERKNSSDRLQNYEN